MNGSAQGFMVAPFCEPPVQIECSVATWIWKLVAPLLVCLGIVGNSLVLVVLSRKKFRALSIVIYLMFLAVSDTTFLVTTLARHFVIRSIGLDVLNLSRFSCIAHRWVIYTAGCLSPWLLVLLTAERTYITVFSRSRHRLDRRKAWAACVTLTTMVMLLTGYLLFIFDLKTVTETTSTVNGSSTMRDSVVCLPHNAKLYAFLNGNWRIIIFIVVNLVPSLIIIAGNSAILLKIIHQHKKLRRQVHTESEQPATSGQMWASATKMVMIVSAVFLITTLPYTIFTVVDNQYFKNATDIKTVARLQLTFAVVHSLLYCNYAFNFWLYFASGSLFKAEWKEMNLATSEACRRLIGRLTRRD